MAQTLNKRTWNSNHFNNEDGTVTATFKNKWVNFYDTDDSWQPIDPNFTDKGTHFEMNQAPFTAKVPKTSTGMATFIGDNGWDIFNNEKITDDPVTMTTTAVGVTDVPGVIESGDLGFGTVNYVVYPNAYPALNADLIYWVHQALGPRFRRIIRFNSNPSLAADERIEFVVDYDTPLIIKNGGKVWNERSALKTEKPLDMRPPQAKDPGRGINFRDFLIWDSQTKQGIDIEFKRTGQNFLLTKIIPKAFMDSATYPVYADDTTGDLHPDADPETTSVDGRAGQNSATQTWTTAVNAAGNSAVDNGVEIQAWAYVASGTTDRWDEMYRGIYLFDTSSITDGWIIDSADFKLFISGKRDDTGISEPTSIVSSAPASNTAIVGGDYNSLGSTKLASDLAWASISTAAYNTFALNAAGLATVSDTGVTKLGCRGASDIADVAPTWGSGHIVRLDIVGADNGSNEPILNVTFSEPPPVAASRRSIIIT